MDKDERKEVIKTVEQIIADIQLFGSSKQIELVKSTLSKLKGEVSVNLDELLDELRRSLRKELGLKAVEGKVHFFRIND